MRIEKQASVLTAGTPDAEQLRKINLQAKTPLTAQDVYVFSVRLCDDQPDRDFERFQTEALHALAKLFVGKTGIVDHAWSSEKQTARIFDTGVEYQDGCAFIKAWAYMLRSEKNEPVIREIEAGIKREVSVGCQMGKSICSVCGAEYGTCSHQKGEVYGAEVCTAVLCEPVDAYEFSFVAVPAQRQAGVLKALGGSDDELRQLREQAALGKQYRSELADRVVRLALLLELGFAETMLRKMVSALEPGELRSAEKELEKRAAKRFPPVCQLGRKKEIARKTDSAFLI